MRTNALTHIGMSVPVGSLTPQHRADILAFYGDAFGWKEMRGVSNAERLTILIAPQSYINVRETAEHQPTSYEHFGVLVDSADEVDSLWTRVTELGASPDPLKSASDGYPSFKFQHLLPMGIEVQHFPSGQLGRG